MSGGVAAGNGGWCLVVAGTVLLACGTDPADSSIPVQLNTLGLRIVDDTDLGVPFSRETLEHLTVLYRDCVQGVSSWEHLQGAQIRFVDELVVEGRTLEGLAWSRQAVVVARQALIDSAYLHELTHLLSFATYGSNDGEHRRQELWECAKEVGRSFQPDSPP